MASGVTEVWAIFEDQDLAVGLVYCGSLAFCALTEVIEGIKFVDVIKEIGA